MIAVKLFGSLQMIDFAGCWELPLLHRRTVFSGHSEMFGCYYVSSLDLRCYRLTMWGRHVDISLVEYYTASKVFRTLIKKIFYADADLRISLLFFMFETMPECFQECSIINIINLKLLTVSILIFFYNTDFPFFLALLSFWIYTCWDNIMSPWIFYQIV